MQDGVSTHIIPFLIFMTSSTDLHYSQQTIRARGDESSAPPPADHLSPSKDDRYSPATPRGCPLPASRRSCRPTGLSATVRRTLPDSCTQAPDPYIRPPTDWSRASTGLNLFL